MPKPGSPEWRARIAAIEAEESTQPIAWWYLSFAEPGDWKGGIIVEARGMMGALTKANALKINPGGEVKATCLGPELPPNTPLELTNRLLTKADMDRLMGGTEKW